MGLPCRHEINRMTEEKRRLSLTDIHQYWWYSPPLPPLLPPPPLSPPPSSTNLLQNPPVLTRKGRPRGSKNVPKTSTRRYPSHFEILDADTNKRQRQRQRSPSPFPQLYQYSRETEAVLAEIRARKPCPSLSDSEDDPAVTPPPILEDDLAEEAIMEIERQRLVNSGGSAPPLWSEMPEFAGMTRAVRPERGRKRKRDRPEAEGRPR